MENGTVKFKRNRVTLQEGLESAGFEINTELLSSYASGNPNAVVLFSLFFVYFFIFCCWCFVWFLFGFWVLSLGFFLLLLLMMVVVVVFCDQPDLV